MFAERECFLNIGVGFPAAEQRTAQKYSLPAVGTKEMSRMNSGFKRKSTFVVVLGLSGCQPGSETDQLLEKKKKKGTCSS